MPQHTIRYVGGPLDGEEIDATDWTHEQLQDGAYIVVDGWADRADYAPEMVTR